MRELEAGTAAPHDGLVALRRFTRTRTGPQVERCELCGAALNAEHPHLLERKIRRIACSCMACALLFCGQQGGRYLQVPKRVLQLSDFAFTDVEWEEMMLPIGLAFFLRNESGGAVALYPGAAGVVESLIPLHDWSERVSGHPVLSEMEPDVEALIVNRIGSEHAYFLVPIDECYRLTGLIRKNWRGLSGGAQVWGVVAGFFEELRQKAEGKAQVRYA